MFGYKCAKGFRSQTFHHVGSVLLVNCRPFVVRLRNMGLLGRLFGFGLDAKLGTGLFTLRIPCPMSREVTIETKFLLFSGCNSG